MPRKKDELAETNVKDKIEYLGLNFDKVPNTLIQTKKLNFKSFKTDNERQYKQYRYINVSDIDILLTPKNRMDSLKDKYEEASPLYMYLDSSQEKNASKYATFLKMLKKVEISDVENIEEEQKKLEEEIPFKVKYNGNYLWQIYYSEAEDRYFMLVPTEDSEYATFFYLLKKKIENKKKDMIFVPVSYLEYSGNILKKSDIKELENYLWLFTKDYPSIYEVYDQNQKLTLVIIGETLVYEKIKTLYKMEFNTKKEAGKFFKLLKALFILQIELPHYFHFETKINRDGALELYLNGYNIQYESILEFISNQYETGIKAKQNIEKEIEYLNIKLAELKQESGKLEQEYVEQEKIISTFLECKKSFFGKVKYYFKFGRKSKKLSKKETKSSNNAEEIELKQNKNKKYKIEDRNYTLDELIIAYKELEASENTKKDIVQDINAIKLKNKNLKKKIENATAYIDEINEHKKSIFDFWKYSNKDEVAALEEGEEIESVTKIQKTFDFENDFEDFGKNIDKSQRMKFTDSELDSSFVASTKLLNVLNDIYIYKTMELKDFSELIKKIKKEKEETGDEFDIFGNLDRYENKERNLGNKTHRESPRNIFEILDIKNGMKPQELKKNLVEIIKNIKKAVKKNNLEENIYVYKVIEDTKDKEGLQLFSLSEENEINSYIKNNNITDETINLIKLKLPKGSNFIAMSNIILYNNKNMTLPVGMTESDKILLDLHGVSLEEVNKENFLIRKVLNEKDDFSDQVFTTVEVTEIQI